MCLAAAAIKMNFWFFSVLLFAVSTAKYVTVHFVVVKHQSIANMSVQILLERNLEAMESSEAGEARV